METLGYCEKHQRAYEIKRIPGSWVYECPECRAEGAYDTYATTSTKMTPVDEWTTSNRTVIKNVHNF
jgi:hypothetical protein